MRISEDTAHLGHRIWPQTENIDLAAFLLRPQPRIDITNKTAFSLLSSRYWNLGRCSWCLRSTRRWRRWCGYDFAIESFAW